MAAGLSGTEISVNTHDWVHPNSITCQHQYSALLALVTAVTEYLQSRLLKKRETHFGSQSVGIVHCYGKVCWKERLKLGVAISLRDNKSHCVYSRECR